MVRTQRGYTMIEMLLVVAIVGLVSSITSYLIINMINFWRQSSARTTIQQDVRASLDIIDRFTRQAQGSTVVIDQVSSQPPYSRITYTTIQGWNISIYQQGNKLYMKNNSEVSVLSTALAYISFSYPHSDDTTLLSVAMTTQALTYKGGKKALQLSIQNIRIMN